MKKLIDILVLLVLVSTFVVAQGFETDIFKVVDSVVDEDPLEPGIGALAFITQQPSCTKTNSFRADYVYNTKAFVRYGNQCEVGEVITLLRCTDASGKSCKRIFQSDYEKTTSTDLLDIRFVLDKDWFQPIKSEYVGYDCKICEPEQDTSTSYCDPKLYENTGVTANCVVPTGQKIVVKNIQVFQEEFGGKELAVVREDKVYPVRITLINKGSFGSEYVEVGIYDESGSWLKPLQITSSGAQNCRVNEKTVSTKLVTMNVNAENTLDLFLYFPNVQSTAEFRLGANIYHRCYTNAVGNAGGSGETSSVFKVITIKDRFIGDEDAVTCDNTFIDGDETDFNCGGVTCKACDTGQSCLKDADCSGSAICYDDDKRCFNSLTPGWEDGKSQFCKGNDVYGIWMNERGARSERIFKDCEIGKTCTLFVEGKGIPATGSCIEATDEEINTINEKQQQNEEEVSGGDPATEIQATGGTDSDTEVGGRTPSGEIASQPTTSLGSEIGGEDYGKDGVDTNQPKNEPATELEKTIKENQTLIFSIIALIVVALVFAGIIKFTGKKKRRRK